METVSFSIILESKQDRVDKAKLIAEKIRMAKGYSWVGLYDVKDKEISLVTYSGRTEPTFTTFPKDKGLNGRALMEKKTVIANDIESDEDYLLTFSDTLSEIVVPVFADAGTRVAGTIDVESELKDAFNEEDAKFLEECSAAIQALWHD